MSGDNQRVHVSRPIGLPPSVFAPLFLIQRAIAAAAALRRLPGGVAIPFSGVIVRPTDVRRHRYLAAHGLPHSQSMASVHLGWGK